MEAQYNELDWAEPQMWLICVKHRDNDLAVQSAVDRLGDGAVIHGTAKHLPGYREVTVLVQCKVQELQKWFNEDLDKHAPFPDGSLLLFNPWTKSTVDRMAEAKLALVLDDPA